MKKLLKIGVLLIIISLLVTQTEVLSFLKPKPTYAVGDLAIDWGPGVTPGDPIFTIANMAPGDGESRGVTITNGATSGRPVAVKGTATTNTGDLSDVMHITIADGPTVLYGPKTVTQFLAESLDPEGIPLMTVNPGDAKNVTFLVEFDEAAGNEYQNKELVFDIIIGISIDIPEACGIVDLTGTFPIFGTSGNDTLRGTSKVDVIVGLEGNDRIEGGIGNDCLIGGTGNDTILGGNGLDILTGNEGDDTLDGGNESDVIDGGAGNDRIVGGNGADTLSGGADNDTMNGGNENDTMTGGNGNDTMHGDNGNDTVQGEEGNDTMTGGNGIDTLTGGNGTDSANGNNGNDSCSAETKVSCELSI